MVARTRTFVSTCFVGYSCASNSFERVRGSHHIFRRAGVKELINLQRDGESRQAVSSETGSACIAEVRFRRG